MKIFNLFFLFVIVSCAGEQPAPTDTDSSMQESVTNDNETSTFDFKNHDVVHQSFDFLSEVINEHQPLYLKLSPPNEPNKSLYLGSIDADTSLSQLRLHVPSNIDSIEYQLFNANGFAQFGTVNF